MYGRQCPNCLANLDPSEKCDCEKQQKEESPITQKRKTAISKETAEYKGAHDENK